MFGFKKKAVEEIKPEVILSKKWFFKPDQLEELFRLTDEKDRIGSHTSNYVLWKYIFKCFDDDPTFNVNKSHALHPESVLDPWVEEIQ